MRKLIQVLFIMLIVSHYVTAQWTTNASGDVINNNSSGNVGIGVDPPLEKLHINGSIRGNSSGGSLRINTATGYLDLGSVNTAYAHFYTDRPKYYFNRPVTVDGAISSYGTNDLTLQTNVTTRISVLASNGYTGIGTSTPNSMLHVAQSNNTDWAVQITNAAGSGKGLLVRSAAGSSDPVFQVEDNYNVNRFTVQSNGNIGIGTSSPQGRLQVNDNSRDYYVNRKITGNTEDSQGTNYLLLHSIYTSSALPDSYVMGKITGIRGGTAAWNRKWTVEVNTASAYTSNRGSIISYNEGARLVTLTFNGVTYLAVEIVSNSTLYSFSFTGYAHNEVLQIVYDQSVANVQPFTQLDNVNIQGNVGIGTTSPDAKLTVKGIIHAQQVNVDLNGAVAPDYVFEPNYKLLSLEEIKSYIEANKHLPDVPPAKEIEAKGINVSEMNLLLLRKIEELTLHVIELKNENDRQNKIIQELTSTKK